MKSDSATQLLRDENKIIRGLLTQSTASEARAPEMRSGVIRELCMMLEVHLQLEEEILYPAMQDEEELTSLIANVREKMDAIHEVVLLLRSVNAHLDNADRTAVDAFLQELNELVSEYMDTEEREIFPQAQTIMARDDLRTRMQERKNQLLASPRYQDSNPAQVQDPNGGEQKRKALKKDVA